MPNVGLYIKLAVVGAVIAAVTIFVGLYRHQHGELEQEKKNNTVLSDANKDLNKTVDQQDKTAKVTDDVVSKSVDDTASVAKGETKIDQTVEQEKAVVNKKYDNLPKPATPVEQSAQQAAKDAEISRIQVTSLWQSYCEAVPTTPKCATILNQPTGNQQ